MPRHAFPRAAFLAVAALGVLAPGSPISAQPIELSGVEHFSSDTYVSRLGVGDFDEDGILDVVGLGQPLTPGIALFRGDGRGGFQPPLTLAPSPQHTTSSVHVADWNGDGHLDIAYTDRNLVRVLLCNGQGGVLGATSVFTGGGPVELAPFDFDGDLDLDVAVTLQDSGGIHILTNDGSGTLSTHAMLATPEGARPIVAARIDGDAFVDLVVAGYLGTFAFVLIGDGTGGFTRGLDLPNPAFAIFGMVAADLDGDGDTDLVTEDQGASNIYLGNGAGGFAAPVPQPVVPSALWLSAGDVNGDTHLDLLFASHVYGRVHVLLGNGAAGFTHSGSFVPGGAPTDVMIVDADRDGDPDIVTPNGRSIAVLLGDGQGSFRDPPRALANLVIADATGRDVDRDGHRDLLACTSSPPRIVTALGLGDGSFVAGPVTPVAESSLIADGHLDSDGNIDVATVGEPFGDVQTLLGTGDGSFVPADTSTSVNSPRALFMLDFDEDGLLDVCVLHELLFSVYSGLGDGRVANPIGWSVGGRESVVIADLDADGHLDVIAANQTDSTLSIRFGTGGGNLNPTRTTVPLPAPPRFLRVADVNLDGIVDILGVSVIQSVLIVLPGAGNRSFGTPSVFSTTRGPQSLRIVDFDRDGDPDAAVAAPGSGLVAIHANDGSGRFPLSRIYGVGDDAGTPIAGDFDEDGLADLAIPAGLSGGLTVLMNATRPCGAGSVASAVLSINGSFGGPARTVVVPRGSPIRLDLAATASGPSPATYALWLWNGLPVRTRDLIVGNVTIDCTVNPSPLDAPMSPQPFQCLRGAGVHPAVCGSVPERANAPSTAPFSVQARNGIGRSTRITVQGVIRSASAGNASGFSVTNAITLRVD